MQKTTLQATNLTDLTNFWKTISDTFQAYHAGSDFDYCSAWPNRLWFHQAPSIETISKVKKIITETTLPFIVPYWDIYEENKQHLLEQAGFEPSLKQIAMFLTLKNTYAIDPKFQLKKISQESEAQLWTNLVAQAFKHKINPTTIFKNRQNFSIYIAYYEGEAVGTVLANLTNNNVGIHLVGVPPQYRRRGFAALIMKQLINFAIEEKRASMTLQASDMGKGLYLKLGFEEQFLITSYRLTK